MEDDLLALGSRRRLYEVVQSAPGIGGREVQRRAGTGWGETAYHLDRLVDAGLIHRERTGHQDHYFVSEVPIGERGLLRLARSPSARRLLVALLERPVQTVPELVQGTGVSEGRLSVHLRRLLETGLVRSGRRERFRTFEVVDRARVIRVLVVHRESFGDEWVERALATYAELFRP